MAEETGLIILIYVAMALVLIFLGFVGILLVLRLALKYKGDLELDINFWKGRINVKKRK